MTALVVSGTLTNTNLSETLQVAALNVTTSANYEHGEIKNILPGAERTVTITTDVADPGYTSIKNLDTQHPVEIGTTTAVYWMRLLPQQFAIVPLDAAVTTLYFSCPVITAIEGVNVRFKVFHSA